MVTPTSRRFLQYRFTVSVDGAPFRILSDFSRDSGFAWRPDLFEHEARIKVMMRNKDPKQKIKTRKRSKVYGVIPEPNGVTN